MPFDPSLLEEEGGFDPSLLEEEVAPTSAIAPPDFISGIKARTEAGKTGLEQFASVTGGILQHPLRTIQKGGAALLGLTGAISPEEYSTAIKQIEAPPPLKIADVETQHTLPGKVMGGAAQIGVDFLNAFMDPDVAFQVGLGGISPAAQKAILGKFAADMAISSPQQLHEGMEALKQNDIQGAVAKLGGGIAQTALSAKLGREAMTAPGGIKVVSPEAIPEVPPELIPERLSVKPQITAPPAKILATPEMLELLPKPMEVSAPEAAPVVRPAATTAEVLGKPASPAVQAAMAKFGIKPEQVKAAEPVTLNTPEEAAKVLDTGIKGTRDAFEVGFQATKSPELADRIRAMREDAVKNFQEKKTTQNQFKKQMLDEALEIVDQRWDKPMTAKFMQEKGMAPPAESPKPTTETVPAYRAAVLIDDRPVAALTGEPGHQEIINRLREEAKKSGDVDLLDKLTEPERGFVDQQGNFLTRSELSKVVDELKGQPAGTTKKAHSYMLPEINELAAKQAKPTAAAPAEFDWDLIYEDLVGNLDSFSPARETGKRNYELDDMVQRFVDYAKENKSGKPLIKLVSDFAKTDEASASQIRKLRAAIKDLDPKLTAPAEPAKPAAEPELVGMGGARPEEFSPPAGTPTGIKNSTVEKERATRGLPPAIEPARKSFGRIWDQAMALVDRDPGAQDRLIEELNKKPRALTDTEDALLLHRQIDLQNEYAKATRDIAQAYEDGRMADVADQQLRVDFLSDELLKLYNINKAAGTETGRGLAARKMMANEDFSLAAMESRKRAARGGKPLTPDERAELVKLQQKIADTEKAFNDQVKRLGLKKAKEGKPLDISQDKEAIKLKAEHEKWKRQFNRGLEVDRMKRRPFSEKAYDTLKEIFNLPRNVMSSWDVSAVLRQGGFVVFGHPVRGAKALGPMFKSLVSEKSARETEQQIINRPNAPLYARSKLYIAPLEDLKLTAQEEQIMSRLADRVPGVRASNRAFITFLNKLRADSFDEMVASIGKDKPLNNAELAAISNYINVATGRGNLGKAAAAAETLATVFFSPRLMASRFQILAGQPLYHGSARTRIHIAKEYARTLIGLGVVYGLGQLAGATIEKDPRSADFGKLRFGNTRVDPLMGLSQNTVLLSRLGTGETMTQRGRIYPIRGKVPYGGMTTADVVGRFLRAKLSPVLGTGLDVATGKNVVGEPVTPGSAALNAVVPLSFADIYDVMLDNGVAGGTAIQILSLFGMGVQSYEDRRRAVPVR